MNLSQMTMENIPLQGLSTKDIILLLLTIILVTILLTTIVLISRWQIYIKAGKKGWSNLIPIYSDIVLLQIVKLPLWYILLSIIPIVNIYYIFKVHIELARKFGKSKVFGILTVFFSFICLPIIAFNKKNKYDAERTNQNDFNQQNSNTISQTPMPTSTTPLFTPPKIENVAPQMGNTNIQQQMVNTNIQQTIINQQNTQNIQINREGTTQENTFKYVFPPKDENQPEPEKPFDNFPKTKTEPETQVQQQSNNNNLFSQPQVTNFNNGNNQNNIN